MADLDKDLTDIIAGEALIDPTKLTREATLTDLGLDSVDLITVVFAVEEKYSLQIPDDAFTHATKFGDLLDILTELIEKSAVS